MAMSLIASIRGVALLPAYAEKFLPWSVTSRPLKGEPGLQDADRDFVLHEPDGIG